MVGFRSSKQDQTHRKAVLPVASDRLHRQFKSTWNPGNDFWANLITSTWSPAIQSAHHGPCWAAVSWALVWRVSRNPTHSSIIIVPLKLLGGIQHFHTPKPYSFHQWVKFTGHWWNWHANFSWLLVNPVQFGASKIHIIFHKMKVGAIKMIFSISFTRKLPIYIYTII